MYEPYPIKIMKKERKPAEHKPANKGKMYKTPYMRNSQLRVNEAKQGETIEQKIERIVNNKEPIKDGAPLIYTERKEGIRASTNIRTDRFEIAIEGTQKIAKSYQARREGKPTKDRPPIGKPESTEGKGENPTNEAK